MKKPDFRTVAEKRLDSLDLERSRFEKARVSGVISSDRYELLLNAWKKKQERAFKSLDREQMFKLPEKKVQVEEKESVWEKAERMVVGFANHYPRFFMVSTIALVSIGYKLF